eukprot:GCRY01004493.1.p1 GENE.GCRY01004493.1~~GCRY01004493.1.p1  ORF type:complete len:183 (-),score=27.76 GCRY01004493.1:299-847(-)
MGSLKERIASFQRDISRLGVIHGFAYIKTEFRCDEELFFEVNSSQYNSRLFLLTCYNMYKTPFTWEQSDRIGKRDTSSNPIDLETLQIWKSKGAILADFVAEIVEMCLGKVDNPFKINRTFFEQLNEEERYFASGLMMGFLRKISILSQENGYRVLPDLQYITWVHFHSIPAQLASSLHTVS